jgi:hypothetical protein
VVGSFSPDIQTMLRTDYELSIIREAANPIICGNFCEVEAGFEHLKVNKTFRAGFTMLKRLQILLDPTTILVFVVILGICGSKKLC